MLYFNYKNLDFFGLFSTIKKHQIDIYSKFCGNTHFKLWFSPFSSYLVRVTLEYIYFLFL